MGGGPGLFGTFLGAYFDIFESVKTYGLTYVASSVSWYQNIMYMYIGLKFDQESESELRIWIAALVRAAQHQNRIYSAFLNFPRVLPGWYGGSTGISL